jgi:hypothetical protein
MRVRWPQCIDMSGRMAAQQTLADGHDRGRSRLTVTLCALFRACAADSHIYFRAVESGNLLIRQCFGYAPDIAPTTHDTRSQRAPRSMHAPSNGWSCVEHARQRTPSCTPSRLSIENVKQTLPSSEVTSIAPWCARAISATMYRPRPNPSWFVLEGERQ